MPVFYALFTVLLLSVVVSLFATAILFRFFLKRATNRPHHIILFLQFIGIWEIFFIVALFASDYGLRQLQAVVAVSYIQQALSVGCELNDTKISIGNFYSSDTYTWKSDDESWNCYFNHTEWICSCP